MPDAQIKVYNTLEELSRAAADFFVEIVCEAVSARNCAYVALSGGSTPRGLFQRLAETAYQKLISWGRLHIYWADERCVSLEDAESNYGQAKKIWLESVAIPGENVHRIHGEMPPAQAAEDYASQLAEAGDGARAWPRLDLALLGMGADGHTASLFPGQVNPDEATRPVIAVTARYRGRPANRVTLTPLVLNSARNVVFLVAGAEKAVALADVLNGPHDPLRLPAQRIQPVDGTVAWLIDTAAARLISAPKGDGF
jgi:6-phosphogluconolactonase